jgi:hypothetical protein
MSLNWGYWESGRLQADTREDVSALMMGFADYQFLAEPMLNLGMLKSARCRELFDPGGRSSNKLYRNKAVERAIRI